MQLVNFNNNGVLHMPTRDEMLAAIYQIRESIGQHRGPGADITFPLYERLMEIGDSKDAEVDDATLLQVYTDAIGTLLLMANPPSIQTYHKVLEELSSLVGMRIEAVRIDNNPESTHRRTGDWTMLDENLPPPRTLTERELETVNYFQNHLQELTLPMRLGDKPR